MGSFVEFTLREGDQDPEFKDIEKLPIDIDQIAFFWPLKDEGGGCRLSLKNGGVVSVSESYDEVRWVTKAQTIREINQTHVESLTESMNEFGVKSNGNLDFRGKLLREAMEIFPAKPSDNIFQTIADAINDILSSCFDFERLTAAQVEENYESIVDFIHDPDEHNFPASVGEGTRAMLRIRLAELTGEELGQPRADSTRNKGGQFDYVETPEIYNPKLSL